MLSSRGHLIGGGARNFNLTEFTNRTGTYREIAKGWMNLAIPSAKYDSHTALHTERLNTRENIGVFHDYTLYLEPGVHTATAGNRLVLLICTGGTNAATITAANAAQGIDWFTFTIDNDKTFIDIPIADDANADGFAISTDAHLVKAGDLFSVNTAFASRVNSNTGRIEYTFDADLFEFAGFNPAAGVNIVDTRIGDGTATVFFMRQGYNLTDIGNFLLRAKDDVDFANDFSKISARAEYIVRINYGEDKFTRVANASTSFATFVMPDSFTIVELSNIIDWFGIKRADDIAAWNATYTFWDFNNNGEICIFDIVFVAQRVA